MTSTNYYCAGVQCRRTTPHVRVRMNRQTYFYCVHCGRRLEVRDAAQEHLRSERRAG